MGIKLSQLAIELDATPLSEINRDCLQTMSEAILKGVVDLGEAQSGNRAIIKGMEDPIPLVDTSYEMANIVTVDKGGYIGNVGTEFDGCTRGMVRRLESIISQHRVFCPNEDYSVVVSRPVVRLTHKHHGEDNKDSLLQVFMEMSIHHSVSNKG